MAWVVEMKHGDDTDWFPYLIDARRANVRRWASSYRSQHGPHSSAARVRVRRYVPVEEGTQ